MFGLCVLGMASDVTDMLPHIALAAAEEQISMWQA